MGERIRTFDWAATPLGPPKQWPVALQTLMSLALSSRQPMFIAWGAEAIWLYNDAFAPILGDKHPQCLGRASSVVWAEAWEQLHPLFSQVFAGEPVYMQGFSVALERDGKLAEAHFDFSYTPARVADGSVQGLFGACIETTERVLAERRAADATLLDVTRQRAALDALQAFTDSIPAIAWIAGADGMLYRFNSQWEAYTGQPAEHALGRAWAKFVHLDDLSVADAIWKAARHGTKEWQVEYRLRGAQGCWRWFKAHAVPQLDAQGRVVQWFGTSTDIEDTRRATQALRDADKQKDEFLATLAHELRNPLAPIRMSVQLLSMPQATPELKIRAAEVIGRQVTHMASMLDDLLDIARLTQRKLVLKRQWLSVEAVIDGALEVARPLAQKKRHELTVQSLVPGVQLMADPVRLTQILANLLNNASKYTDSEGKIKLEVALDGTTLVFAITDNGVGLSAESLGSVFNMFAQEQSALDRSEGGLGIGLALVKGLVELHGGSVAAFSEGMGRGSRFEVRLPTIDTAASPDASAPAPATHATENKTVLLADDNVDAIELLAEVLRLNGHKVHMANNGLQALQMAQSLRPDILILDIGMPGLNGYEVTERIRAEAWQPRPTIIAATGWAQQSDQLRASLSGFDMHLTKPFDPNTLLAHIGRARD